MKKLRKRELAASSLSKEGSGRACCIFRINASNALVGTTLKVAELLPLKV